MAAAIDSISQFAQVANVASKASQAIGVAQQAIAASKVAEMGAPLNMFATAEGTLVSLDQLMNGPLFPRVRDLLLLNGAAEALESVGDAQSLYQVACVRIDCLQLNLSPAEVAQYTLRRNDALPSGAAFAVSPFLLGPGGSKIHHEDLLVMPLYPSVHERYTWMARAWHYGTEKDVGLVEFCRLKHSNFCLSMSEAEAFQFRLIADAELLEAPKVNLALPDTFANFKGEQISVEMLRGHPLPPNLGAINRNLQSIERVPAIGEKVTSASETAQAATEHYRLMMETYRRVAGLSDAELLHLALVVGPRNWPS